MKVINLTPHNVNINTHIFPCSGCIARVSSTNKQVDEHKGVSFFKQELGQVENLPGPAEGVFYIVSRIVASAAKEEGRGNYDLLVPFDLIRNGKGQVIGCNGFEVFDDFQLPLDLSFL